MWSMSEDETAPETVDWIRSAGRLPVTTPEFRAQVMATAVQSQQQISKLRQVQAGITAVVAVCALIVLPTCCRISLSAGTSAGYSRAPATLPAAITAGESYEWRLVESFQEFRDQSARALRGTL